MKPAVSRRVHFSVASSNVHRSWLWDAKSKGRPVRQIDLIIQKSRYAARPHSAQSDSVVRTIRICRGALSALLPFAPATSNLKFMVQIMRRKLCNTGIGNRKHADSKLTVTCQEVQSVLTLHDGQRHCAILFLGDVGTARLQRVS